MPNHILADCLMRPSRSIRLRALLWLAACAALPLQAAPPRLFEATYDASYDKLSATATRSLVFDAGSGHYTLQQEIRLTLLGATVSSIRERSTFRWQDDQPWPELYEYRQSGIGARERSARFDYESGQATFAVNDKEGTLPMEGAVFDELSGYLALREQLAAGQTDISIKVLDRDKLEIQRYRVLGEASLATPLGAQQTLHVERLREGSARRTEIWLAPALDYMLVKLVQTEPNGDVISLDLKTLNTAD